MFPVRSSFVTQDGGPGVSFKCSVKVLTQLHASLPLGSFSSSATGLAGNWELPAGRQTRWPPPFPKDTSQFPSPRKLVKEVVPHPWQLRIDLPAQKKRFSSRQDVIPLEGLEEGGGSIILITCLFFCYIWHFWVRINVSKVAAHSQFPFPTPLSLYPLGCPLFFWPPLRGSCNLLMPFPTPQGSFCKLWPLALFLPFFASLHSHSSLASCLLDALPFPGRFMSPWTSTSGVDIWQPSLVIPANESGEHVASILPSRWMTSQMNPQLRIS